MFTGPVGCPEVSLASTDADPYTGKNKGIMRDRLASRPHLDLRERDATLLRALRDGADWGAAPAQVYDAFVNTIPKRKKIPKIFFSFFLLSL